jgi:hypothetical protein
MEEDKLIVKRYFWIKKDIKKMRVECRPKASAIRTFVLIVARIRKAERVNFWGFFSEERMLI